MQLKLKWKLKIYKLCIYGIVHKLTIMICFCFLCLNKICKFILICNLVLNHTLKTSLKREDQKKHFLDILDIFFISLKDLHKIWSPSDLVHRIIQNAFLDPALKRFSFAVSSNPWKSFLIVNVLRFILVTVSPPTGLSFNSNSPSVTNSSILEKRKKNRVGIYIGFEFYTGCLVSYC